MPRVFVSVGSNIDPVENVRKALRLLHEHIPIKAISIFYRTEPEGRPDQPVFYNGVVEIETDISPLDLKWSVLRKIEDELGRVRSEDKYAPRTIDLDVIIYGDEVISNDDLLVPDPQISERPFLAVPLYELTPDLVLPDTGIPLEKIARGFKDHNMKPLYEYTQTLREDLKDGL